LNQLVKPKKILFPAAVYKKSRDDGEQNFYFMLYWYIMTCSIMQQLIKQVKTPISIHENKSWYCRI